VLSSLGRLLLAVGGAWLVVVLLAAVFQRQLIYLPDRTSPTPPPDVEEVVLTTEDGLDLLAWYLAPATEPVTTILLAPGNAGNRAGRVPTARALNERGHAVLLLDYRGYGGNPGRPSRPAWSPMPGRRMTTSWPEPTSRWHGSSTSGSPSARRWWRRSRRNVRRRPWCCGRRSPSSRTWAALPTRSCRSGPCSATAIRPRTTSMPTGDPCWSWPVRATGSCRASCPARWRDVPRRPSSRSRVSGHNDPALFVGERFVDRGRRPPARRGRDAP
jgi:hypothetical protein